MAHGFSDPKPRGIVVFDIASDQAEPGVTQVRDTGTPAVSIRAERRIDAPENGPMDLPCSGAGRRNLLSFPASRGRRPARDQGG